MSSPMHASHTRVLGSNPMNNVSWSHWQRNVLGKRRRRCSEDEGSDSEAGNHKGENQIKVILAGQLTLDSLKFIVNNRQPTAQQTRGSNRAGPPLHTRTDVKPSEQELPSVRTSSTNDDVSSPPRGVGFQTAAQLAGLAVPCPRAPPQAANSATDGQTIEGPIWQAELLARNKDLSAEHVTRILSSMVPPEQNQVRSNDIGGLSEVKTIIENCIIRPLRRPDLHLGLYRAASGVLLFGPPGTGKTTIAKWIATEASATFFCVSPSTLMSMYLGETESLIKCLFACAAEVAPSIIFLDEIDGLIGKRTSKEEETTLRMKNQLLQAMDGLTTSRCASIIVIGATNRPEALDEAAIRRLSKRIYIPLPDEEAIFAQLTKILARHAREIAVCDCAQTDTDTPTYEHQCSLSSYNFLELRSTVLPLLKGFNGSDIRALCVKAAEKVYQRTLLRFENDIDRIPSSKAFSLPAPEDLQAAAAVCHPSFSGDCDEFDRWAKSFGCA